MIDNDYFDREYLSNRLSYITSDDKGATIEVYAEKKQLVVPFRPPHTVDSRFHILTPNFFSLKDLFDHSCNADIISNEEFMAVQAKRIGLDALIFGKDDYKNSCMLENRFGAPILIVYGMLETGLVTVIDEGTSATRVFTRSMDLIKQKCPACADAMQDKILDSLISAQADHINCFEIFMDKNKYGEWTCEPATYVYNPFQTVTYTLSILAIRREILSKLMSGIIEIGYMDAATMRTNTIKTTLYEKTLLRNMNSSTYMRIIDELYDNRKIASLNLPILEGSGNETAEVFIPTIYKLKYHEQ